MAYGESGPRSRRILTTPVSEGNIRQVVSSTGTLQAVTTVLVGSQVSGTIAKLSADFNSKVKKGEIVAELDQASFAARVEETRANVAAAQANLAKSKVSFEDAERTLKRTKELKQRELVSQSELDAAQTAYDSARSQVSVTQAQVGQAQASMNQAQIDLGYTVIRSPVDGIVISRNIDVGQTVAASLSAPTLFTIANDLTKMEVHTNVDEADVGNITDGQEVSFTVDAHAQRRFRGKVNQVRNAPINVQGVVTYNSVVRINNKELLLKPGMTANVQFLVAQKEDVLTIPNVALRFRPPEEKNEAQELLRQEQGRVGRTDCGAAHQPWRWQRCRRRRGPARAPSESLCAQRRAGPAGRRSGRHHRRLQDRDYRAALNENDPVIIGMSTAATAPPQSGVASPFQPQPVPGGFRGR